MFIHTFYETHGPYLCGEMEKYEIFNYLDMNWQNQDNVRQVRIASRYIDSRRQFYDDMLGKFAVRIIMSDHGRVTWSIVRELRVHTILIIQDEGHKAEKVDGMFSLVDFSKVLEMCIRGEYDFDKVKRDYVVTEALDFYNSALINSILEKEGHSKSEAYQRRAIITPTDRYLRFATGEERYFVGKDDVNDCIDVPEYQERIAQLRDICGDEFIDISRYKKFETAMKLLYSNGKRLYD
jgi:hypothetical protein